MPFKNIAQMAQKYIVNHKQLKKTYAWINENNNIQTFLANKNIYPQYIKCYMKKK